MLPDYPEIKNKICDLYTMRMKNIINNAPFDVGKHTIFEGHRNKIIRHDGTVDDTEFKEIASDLSIDLKNFVNTTVEDILKKIDECAVEMGKQQAQHFINAIDKTVESSGNSVSCSGESFAPKHIFEMLESIEISFNKDNSPIMPTFLAASNTLEIYQKVLKMIEDTPELKKRMDNILDKKRSEWRDRESSRKLVR